MRNIFLDGYIIQNNYFSERLQTNNLVSFDFIILKSTPSLKIILLQLVIIVCNLTSISFYLSASILFFVSNTLPNNQSNRKEKYEAIKVYQLNQVDYIEIFWAEIKFI